MCCLVCKGNITISHVEAMKRFEFEITLFGTKKTFRINGLNPEEARKNLDAQILRSMEVTACKEVEEEKTVNYFDAINDIFKEFGNLFGGSKKP